MTTSSSTQPARRIDRLVDALIDRKHPFWQDERQSAIYNEAASAALVLQTFLIIIVGGIGLVLVGKPAIGLVTAMVLTATLGQFLIFGVLLRRHVEIDVKSWQKHASKTRKVVGLAVGGFYLACFLWVKYRSTKIGKLDLSTIAGLVTGAAFAVALFALISIASKRAIQKRQAQAGGDE